METKVRTLEEFEEEARRFAGTLHPRGNTATLVTLSGELGAGKTAFTKVLARAFGIEETVNSPTFVLEKKYQLPEGSVFARLVHIDAYRLEKGAELSPLGFAGLMADKSNLIVLEWPEKVQDALPQASHRLSITLAPDQSRIISYE